MLSSIACAQRLDPDSWESWTKQNKPAGSSCCCCSLRPGLLCLPEDRAQGLVHARQVHCCCTEAAEHGILPWGAEVHSADIGVSELKALLAA